MEFLYLDAIASEREKLQSKQRRNMNVEEQEEHSAREQGIVFGQLGSFGMRRTINSSE